jgi:hypothetical protein
VPPRYSYWTIIAGGLPTAFRATDRDELLPTFNRLHEKHPDAVMKWFARGRLWNSPEDARVDLQERRSDHGRRQPSARGRPESGRRLEGEKPPRQETRRGRDWRPGGAHRDPRQKYADAKKARNVDRRKQRFDRRQPAARQKAATENTTRSPAGAAPHNPHEQRRDRRRPFERPGFGRGQEPVEPDSRDTPKTRPGGGPGKRSKTNR